MPLVNVETALELKQLKYFIKVAEAGGFSQAAAKLDVAQPFLSRQIRRLEVELKQHLFYRHGRGVLLTDAGEQFLPVAREVVVRLEQAFERNTESHELVGVVSLGIPPSLTRGLAVPLLRKFSQVAPKVSLTIVEGLSRVLHEQILNHQIDIALLHNPPAHSVLTMTPLSTEYSCLVSPKEFFPAEVQSIPFSLLPKLKLIFPRAPHPLRTVLEAQAKTLGHELNIVHNIDSVETILEVVQGGFGHTITSSTATQLGRYDEALSSLPIVSPAVTSTIVLAHDERSPSSLLKRTALALISEVYKETLSAQAR